MERVESVQAKIEDFEPLLPIDVIRPPLRDGGEPSTIPPLEPTEMVESEIEEIRKRGDIPQGREEHYLDKEIPYKGDVIAPVDAEHPLATPPKNLE